MSVIASTQNLNDFNFGPKKSCRICLEQSSENPKQFISPCMCKGTSQFVHEECLQNWIKRSIWKASKSNQGTFYTCQLCRHNIFFQLGSQSWLSWLKDKPCSAIFYLCWIVLLGISLSTVIFLIIYGIATTKYEVIRFLGLPLGFFLLGGFLFIKCGKDFRDYKTGVIRIRVPNIDHKKNSECSSKSLYTIPN